MSILIKNLPQHECLGRKFEEKVLEQIFKLYVKIKKAEIHSLKLLSETSSRGKYDENDGGKLTRLMTQTKLSRVYIAYLGLIKLRGEVNQTGNCKHCSKYMNQNLQFIIDHSKKINRNHRKRIAKLIHKKFDFTFVESH